MAPGLLSGFVLSKVYSSCHLFAYLNGIEARPISIQYPEGWIAQDRPQGYGRDKEIIATITPVHPDYPRVYIAYREIQTNTLKAVAEWGESRLSAGDYETISLYLARS